MTEMSLSAVVAGRAWKSTAELISCTRDGLP